MPPQGQTTDFYVIEVADAAEAERLVLRDVQERIPRAFKLDPLRDVQVLTPMHRGQAGTERLNAALAEALGGGRPEIALPAALRSTDRPRARFRIGDKVMQIRNDYDRDVFNGDIGFVTAPLLDEDQAPSGLIVDFDGRRVEYDADAVGSLELAYAVSIHKSQGSEYPAVVVTLCAAHHMMLRRNLLYTAVTRGAKLVVLVAEPRALRKAVSDASDSDARRDTGLAARARDRARRDDIDGLACVPGRSSRCSSVLLVGCGDEFQRIRRVGDRTDAGIPDEGCGRRGRRADPRGLHDLGL